MVKYSNSYTFSCYTGCRIPKDWRTTIYIMMGSLFHSKIFRLMLIAEHSTSSRPICVFSPWVLPFPLTDSCKNSFRPVNECVRIWIIIQQQSRQNAAQIFANQHQRSHLRVFLASTTFRSKNEWESEWVCLYFTWRLPETFISSLKYLFNSFKKLLLQITKCTF